jgi:hypothetical protein
LRSHHRSRFWLSFRIAPGALSFLIALLGFLAVLPIAEANRLRLKWDQPSKNEDGTPLQDLGGYRVYYGTTPSQTTTPPCNEKQRQVGSITDYDIDDDALPVGTTVYVKVTAVDTSGHESDCSTEVSGLTVAAETPTTSTSGTSTPSASSAGSSGGGGGGGGCFIATAAFGSPMAREVVVLRELRDRYLVTNAPGRAFVTGYYRVSPPIAEWLRQHESARTATRQALRPLVWWAGLLLSSPMAGLALGAVVLVAPLAVVARPTRPLSQPGPRRQP